MSQEELGQQLLVSRQTVSLWENGQTLPTIDNLIRLREIFGVSLDEMLDENETVQQNRSTYDAEKRSPLERYTVRYDEAQLREIQYRAVFPSIRLLTLLAVGFVVGISFVCLLPDFPAFWFGVWIGAFLICLPASLVRFLKCKRKEDRKIAALRNSDVEYEVFEDCLRMSGKAIETAEVTLDEIEYRCKDHLLLTLTAKKKTFYFPCDVLPNESVLLFGKPVKVAKKTAMLSIAFLIVSLLSLLAVPVLAIVLHRIGRPHTEDLFALIAACLALPSIASFLFGVLSRIKKNIAVGSVTAILIYGIAILPHVMNWNPVLEVSYYIDMDLPEYTSMTVSEVDEYCDEVFVYYDAEVYFDEEKIAEWEQRLEESGLWKSGELANEIRTVYPSDEFYQGADYFLFYDIKGKSYHMLSEEAGYRDCFLIVYLEDEHLMRIAKCNVLIEK